MVINTLSKTNHRSNRIKYIHHVIDSNNYLVNIPASLNSIHTNEQRNVMLAIFANVSAGSDSDPGVTKAER